LRAQVVSITKKILGIAEDQNKLRAHHILESPASEKCIPHNAAAIATVSIPELPMIFLSGKKY
jgi:hypothetical protein